MTTKVITQERVKSLFDYREDGNLVRRVQTSNRVKIGDVVGWGNSTGYMSVNLDGSHWLIHRLIYLYHHGVLPKVIDHIDGNPLNNKIENLREATMEQNSLNQKGRKNSYSGIKNVYWHKKLKKWYVHVKRNKGIVHFGMFEDLEFAELVAIMAREKYHGQYANHGAVA